MILLTRDDDFECTPVGSVNQRTPQWTRGAFAPAGRLWVNVPWVLEAGLGASMDILFDFVLTNLSDFLFNCLIIVNIVVL